MTAARPLLVARDAELAEETTRLAAASGSELVRTRELSAPAWRTAPLVLLDAAAAAAGVAGGLPRRRGVVVLCRDPTPELWQIAFEAGADQVITLPAEETKLIELLADAADVPVQDGRILAVLGGCGGAGASVLATASAVLAARGGARALLVDCDPLGGGVDLAVGAEADDGLRWSGLAVNAGRLGATALHEALPERRIGSGAITVLSCDRDGPSTGLTAEGVRAVLAAGRRAGDVVVCDVPRVLPEPAVAALREADLVVVVVPAELRAVAAAERVVAAVGEHAAGPIRLVVRGPAPGGLRTADVVGAVGAEVLTGMRPEPQLPALLDCGGLAARLRRRGPVARAAQQVLAELARLEPVATAC
ncbi:helicase/secretion neighborhood CpaE-like protein [Saccharopolyspora antimicrobica]|uniref:Helicase/secretion neighborhood CpaE-like protein n=1 Tax=Saccharopolyspora antimicrobica TaxID=455193 RepID=A0A1I5G040_9PSEU|nr:septum site-determining protein Ssd [Saccharopolyspora antimicrobica]RKT83992.1 secretion/DNA translocation related CpaE-like protein [Saccharopolyspora antimicrobica]SFO29377.1 helicase/secretion neighborhood CpaE-like protein [Saccharopolyspora antimicrobica]